MRRTRVLSLALIICLVLGCAVPAYALDAPNVDTARSVLIGDMRSGRLLFAENAYTRSEPASLTKIMTLLVAVEAVERGEVSVNDSVTASADCNFDLTDDSSTAQIHEGETMPFEELLYCAALASANEACNIIAEHVAGSTEKFVQRMNDRAAELGCTGTCFKNTHGLPANGHCTTARDLFLIANEAMRHELFARLVGTAEHTVPATNASGARQLSNSNALLSSKSQYGDGYIYSGAIGVKTGRTDAAGLCLVGAAERDGLRFMTVVLGASKSDESENGVGSFIDTRTLLDWAFENFSYRNIITTADIVGTQPVLDGERWGKLDLCPASDITALAPNDLSADGLTKQITLYSDSAADVAPGTELGEMTVSDPDGTVYGTVKFVAAGKVRYDDETVGEEAQPAQPDDVRRNAIIMVAAIFALFAALTVFALVRRSKLRRRKVRR